MPTERKVAIFSYGKRRELWDLAVSAANEMNDAGCKTPRNRPYTPGDVIALWATLGRDVWRRDVGAEPETSD
jgi:hypothetical protein